MNMNLWMQISIRWGIVGCLVLRCLTPIAFAGGYAFNDINYPNGQLTRIYDNSGSTVVGYYFDSQFVEHGFSETDGVFTSIDAPMAGSDPLGSGTYPEAVSGSTIVGYSYDKNFSYLGYHGFSLTGGVFTPVNYPPLAVLSAPPGFGRMSGNTIVGSYAGQGFIVVNGAFSSLNFPFQPLTFPGGVDGSTVVGSYFETSQHGHGFVESGGQWTTFDHPSAVAIPHFRLSKRNVCHWNFR